MKNRKIISSKMTLVQVIIYFGSILIN